MTDVLYELTNLSKRYTRGKESVAIFEDLTMTINRGDFIAIMGPSGSGKTTLLNLLGGIDKPSGGQVVCNGLRIDNLSQAKLSKWRSSHVGFIFQFYNLMPTLTAAQNVELPLLLTNLSGKERKRRVQTALEVVKLADRGKHRPRQLSGGQQQRVAIARALVADPDVLLCDEPTGDLDRTTADEILETLQLLNSELGKTIVMVTHDPAAAKYARRELHLDKGRFVESGAMA
ncbi:MULTISPECIES: ABC transporter ATP-binding protein [Oceanicaulis]|jgi:putative ABC transport system ATP-binding protein|uniref:ABC transporter ATP-binding protein n=1 Tax=Oceanicaulis TaxID=153232 RepID=UPI0003B5E809|nr:MULTISPECIES: ABC transporter ATP-binding protein [Oceanicaulis]MBL4537078.1 ABC transporter ATP-binding protein [Oceanicaulis sp.]|tara:strand:+ start:13534 stop:14226 length:693 start_codon:yes stop_codon:yes gene_type:complete